MGFNYHVKLRVVGNKTKMTSVGREMTSTSIAILRLAYYNRSKGKGRGNQDLFLI